MIFGRERSAMLRLHRTRLCVLEVLLVGGVLQPSGERAPEPLIDVGHVVDAVIYMANLPLNVNVPFMTVMATKMPYLATLSINICAASFSSLG